MYTLKNVEEYKMMRKSIIKTSSFYTNICFFATELIKYIDNEKAYCIKLENGFLLILEEKKYYKLYLYGDFEQEYKIKPMDKKIVFRHTYRRNKNEECPDNIKKFLIHNNFIDDGTLVSIHATVDELYNKCLKLEPYVRKIEAKGYRFVDLDSKYHEQADAMLYSTEKIRDYHLEGEDTQKTYHAIVDERGELCAVCIGIIAENSTTGAMMIKDEYKIKGFAPMISYYRYKWMKENGIQNNVGWIYVNNASSLNYFKGLGYEFDNKYIDEWVLNS